MNKSIFNRIFLLFLLFNVLFMLTGCGEDSEKKIVYAPYEQDKIIRETDGPGAPVITDSYILFTADPKYRTVGIAFDFEDYKTVHPFTAYIGTDENGKQTPKHLFYCYERNHKISTIKYRLIIEGLWTTDPLNSVKEYDDDVNLYFSVVNAVNADNYNTEVTEDGFVHFVYRADPGEEVWLSGSFCNWDPWIYTMHETRPGIYELNLPLADGTYYYNYYIGFTPTVDNTNSQKAYTSDGRMVSVIKVK